MTTVWHDGHVMGGYQNPACPACQREERQRLRAQALEQDFSDEFAAGYISAIDDIEALISRAATPAEKDRTPYDDVGDPHEH